MAAESQHKWRNSSILTRSDKFRRHYIRWAAESSSSQRNKLFLHTKVCKQIMRPQEAVTRKKATTVMPKDPP
jgi:hypothetical protein